MFNEGRCSSKRAYRTDLRKVSQVKELVHQQNYKIKRQDIKFIA